MEWAGVALTTESGSIGLSVWSDPMSIPGGMDTAVSSWPVVAEV